MEAISEEIEFALGVRAIELFDGSKKYFVKTQNHGVPQEVLITLLRHWLRMTEDSYSAEFKGENGQGAQSA
ncbi:MAG: hypothetical protein Q7K43_06445 [Candidatus Woesearchaeota archaeon]|nr:hypothetical protein [Candidatus Woesearchaeota archaeon]